MHLLGCVQDPCECPAIAIERRATSFDGANKKESTPMKKTPQKPEIVCLCGSTRYLSEYAEANRRLTLEGRIVLSIGNAASTMNADEKTRADRLHLHKIAMADRVHVLNVGGYVGDSTRNEIAFAIANGKRITWHDSAAGAQYLVDTWDKLAETMAGF